MSGKQISRLANSYLCWQKSPFQRVIKTVSKADLELVAALVFPLTDPM